MYNVARVTWIRDSLCVPKGKRTVDSSRETKTVEKLWKHYEESGFLSARILDHLSDDNISLVDPIVILDLIQSLPHKPFQIISVHDCFRALPNYGNDIRRQYNLLLAGIAKSRLLSYLLTQITGRKMEVGKLDYSLWKDIEHTNYALS